MPINTTKKDNEEHSRHARRKSLSRHSFLLSFPPPVCWAGLRASCIPQDPIQCLNFAWSFQTRGRINWTGFYEREFLGESGWVKWGTWWAATFTFPLELLWEICEEIGWTLKKGWNGRNASRGKRPHFDQGKKRRKENLLHQISRISGKNWFHFWEI